MKNEAPCIFKVFAAFGVLTFSGCLLESAENKFEPAHGNDTNAQEAIEDVIDLGGLVAVPAYVGSTANALAENAGACVPSGAPERVFLWTAPTSGTYVFTTAGTGFDTVLYVRDTDGIIELACDDDDEAFQSRVEISAVEGIGYRVFVDGYGESESGDFQLNIEML